MSKYYDRDGTPISDVIAWGKKMDNWDYKRVAQDTLEDGRWVSTVWLGLDHRWDDNGPPLIFETMVFTSRDDLDDNYCERYSTEAQALEGHNRIVEDLKAGRDLHARID